MGKYVAVGVLAVIVLAAATYDRPKTPEGQQAASEEEASPAEGEPVYAIDYEPIETAPAEPAPIASQAAPISLEPQVASATAPVSETQATIQKVAEVAKVLEYTVKKGQTLSDVAGELLGDRGKWRQLYEANKDRLPNPDQVRAGMKLVYERIEASQSKPATAPRSGGTALAASAPRTSGRTYRVVKGDTLYSIAKSQLGSGGRWKEITALNGIDGAQVKVGQTLKLPAK